MKYLYHFLLSTTRASKRVSGQMTGKKGTGSPVYRKDDKNVKENYSPVTVLSCKHSVRTPTGPSYQNCIIGDYKTCILMY